MRTIKNIYSAHYAPINDLITYSPLPSEEIEQIDPFLFLNHHGPQKYPPDNNGLPFRPHPHRGMETVTFILEGDIMHKDSSGSESIITAGGVQWMTAGKGLIHAEVSSDDFKKSGGPMEILQLWINLPAKLKMTEPNYKGLQKEDIPSIKVDNEMVTMNIVAGKWRNSHGAFNTLTEIFLSIINFEPGGKLSFNVPLENNIFFYVIRGKLSVNNRTVNKLQLAEFNNDDESIEIKAEEKSILLFGYAKPFNEPVVARGPFVMNTGEEIVQAYKDYQQGKFGIWKF